jgi:hypothetical protein
MRRSPSTSSLFTGHSSDTDARLVRLASPSLSLSPSPTTSPSLSLSSSPHEKQPSRSTLLSLPSLRLSALSTHEATAGVSADGAVRRILALRRASDAFTLLSRLSLPAPPHPHSPYLPPLSLSLSSSTYLSLSSPHWFAEWINSGFAEDDLAIVIDRVGALGGRGRERERERERQREAGRESGRGRERERGVVGRSILGQLSDQLNFRHPSLLAFSDTPLHVRFAGEGGQDAGGLFREALSVAADAAVAEGVLSLSPNGRENVGRNRSALLASPTAHPDKLRLLGRLLGIVVFSSTPLPLDLSPTILRAIVDPSPLSAKSTLELLEDVGSFDELAARLCQRMIGTVRVREREREREREGEGEGKGEGEGEGGTGEGGTREREREREREAGTAGGGTW